MMMMSETGGGGVEDNNWVIEVDEEVNRMGDYTTAEAEHWKKRSIYRVPAVVTDLNKKAFKPRAVSFGPYHHGEEHLKAMEVHKRRALLHFLKRSDNPLNDYVDTLAEVVEDLMDSYDSLDEVTWKQNPRAFLQLMILDGCFMLEILRTAGTHSPDDYAPNDPIFSHHGKFHIMPYIKRDMLMLENQLPMLVLVKLLAAESHKLPTATASSSEKDMVMIKKLIVQFCSPNVPVGAAKSMGECLHVLDVYRHSLLWEDPHRRRNKSKQTMDPGLIIGESGGGAAGEEIIRSATELNEAGIRFKKSKTWSLKEISFRGGVLKLPPIVVDDATESTFLNLMAFERFHVGVGNEVTSYIFFMDNIIDNARDVSLLHSRGIIQNAIGSDKAVAKLFNSLSKDITLDPDSSLDVVHKKVSVYCKKRWNEWRANLIHTYFRSPWAILSLVAAAFLFALTIAQTIYTIYPYYHQK